MKNNKKAIMDPAVVVFFWFFLLMWIAALSIDDRPSWPYSSSSYASRSWMTTSFYLCDTDNSFKTKKECIDSEINSQVKDPFVVWCIEKNIDSKDSLAKSITNNTVTKKELQDLDSLARECYYYWKDKNLAWSSASSYPVFWNFVSALAWSFVWNYIWNKLFEKDRNNGYVWYYGWNSSFGSSSSSWLYDTYDSSPSSTKSTSDSKKTTLDKWDAAHKTNTWNVKEMKAASSASSNYKLWDTWKSWTTTSTKSYNKQNTNSSLWSKSATSTSKSTSTSTSKSTSSSRSSLW